MKKFGISFEKYSQVNEVSPRLHITFYFYKWFWFISIPINPTTWGF